MADSDLELKKGRVKIATVLCCVLVLLISMLVLAYLGGAYYFQKHFLPGTIINGQKVDDMTEEMVTDLLNSNRNSSYRLSLLDDDDNEFFVLTAEEVGLKVSYQKSVAELLENQNEYLWFTSFVNQGPRYLEASCSESYDLSKLEYQLDSKGFFDNAEGRYPENAYIGEYISQTTEYELIPEKEGTLLDKAVTLERIGAAIEQGQTQMKLRENGCYVQPEITTQNQELQTLLKDLNRVVGTRITYDWNGSEEVLDGDLIHQWISVEEGQVILDESKVREYVAEKAKAYDTYGRQRKFTTSQGVELTLPSGGYGWKTDRETETETLMGLIYEGSVTDREPEYTCTGYVKGKNDIGSSYVEADMTNQHLYLYIDGEIVLETDFVSGDVSEGNATPAGVFGITYKTTNAVLRGRTYETPVSYWMPFNGNIGMHDATWRRSFGGDIYLNNGSHGCINLPLDMAEAIYGYMKRKFPVVCYYY